MCPGAGTYDNGIQELENSHLYCPDDGWSVNSHIIELPTQLLVIDAPCCLYAQEVVSYARTLNRPIRRLYVAHYHPDHLLGAVAFQAPIDGLEKSKPRLKIEVVGDRVAGGEHEKHPDRIPPRGAPD
jgi:glyoxylase-like metal-dependent hydrolase (beta-lactamase superfamily II)